MAQILRPISDVSGNWSCSTGSDRYALIDETTASDSDYISGAALSSTQVCLFSEGQTPAVRTEHLIRVRAKKGEDALKTYTLTVYLKEGSTTIKSESIGGSLTTSYQNFDITLSEAEAGNISNYTNLSVAFDATSYGVYVSHCYITIPDAPIVPSIGLEMGCSF